MTKSNDFYNSDEWRKVRYAVLEKNKAKCMCCGASGKYSPLHVDHIRPRSLYPELELDEDNLQILCESCNLGKSNEYETDWRPKVTPTLDRGKLQSYINSVKDRHAQD